MATTTTTDDKNGVQAAVSRRGNTEQHTPSSRRPRKRVTETREELALALRAKGYTERRIAADLGMSPSSVHEALERALSKRKLLTDEQLIAQKHEQTMILEHKIEEAVDAWEKSKRNAETEKIVEKSIGKNVASEEPQPHGGRLKRVNREPIANPSVIAEDADISDVEEEDLDVESIPGYFHNEETGEETEPEEKAAIMFRWLREKIQEKAEPVAIQMILERTVTTTSAGRAGDPRFLADIRANLAEIRKIWGTDAPVKHEFTGKDGGAINVIFTDSLNRVYGES